MAHDCGHDCCETRDNPYHDHTLLPEDCLICEQVRKTGIMPHFAVTLPKTTTKSDG